MSFARSVHVRKFPSRYSATGRVAFGTAPVRSTGLRCPRCDAARPWLRRGLPPEGLNEILAIEAGAALPTFLMTFAIVCPSTLEDTGVAVRWFGLSGSPGQSVESRLFGAITVFSLLLAAVAATLTWLVRYLVKKHRCHRE